MQSARLFLPQDLGSLSQRTDWWLASFSWRFSMRVIITPPAIFARILS